MSLSGWKITFPCKNFTSTQKLRFFFSFIKQFFWNKTQWNTTFIVQSIIVGRQKTFSVHIRFDETSFLFFLWSKNLCVVKHVWRFNIWNSSINRPRVLFNLLIILSAIMIVIIVFILGIIVTSLRIGWFTFVFGASWTHFLFKTFYKVNLRKFRTIHWSIIIELFSKTWLKLLTNIWFDFLQSFRAFAIA